MKIASFLGVSYLFASMVAAVPLARREMVVVTVTDYTTLTVGLTTTVYVDPALSPAPTTPTTTSTSSTTSTTEPARIPSSNDAAQFFVPPTTTPAPTPAPVQQPAIVEQPPSPPPLTTAPAPTPVPSPPPSSSSGGGATDYSSDMNGVSAVPGGSALAGGICTPGSPCSGDMTYYDVGLGACGWTDDGDTKYVVALPHGMMGEQSNGNPFCGKTLNVKYGEKVIKARAVDKCMGCGDEDIDLSNKAFEALADMSLGRVKCTWWFD